MKINKEKAIEVGKICKEMKLELIEHPHSFNKNGFMYEKEKVNGLLCNRVFPHKTKEVLYDEEYDKVKGNIKVLKHGCHWNAKRVSALLGAEVVYGLLVISKKGEEIIPFEHSWNRLDGEDFDLTADVIFSDNLSSFKRRGYSCRYYAIDSYKVSKLDKNEHMEYKGGDVAKAFGAFDQRLHYSKGEYYAVA